MSDTTLPHSGRNTDGRFGAGNAGRPIGTRNRLSQRVLRTILTDFEANQEMVLTRMRSSYTRAYLSIVARLLPRQIEVAGIPDPASYTAEEVAVMIGRMRTAIERVELGEGSFLDLEEAFIAAEQAAVGLIADGRTP